MAELLRHNITDRWNPLKVWHIEYRQASEHYYLAQSVGDWYTAKPRRYRKRDIEQVLNIKISRGGKAVTHNEH